MSLHESDSPLQVKWILKLNPSSGYRILTIHSDLKSFGVSIDLGLKSCEHVTFDNNWIFYDAWARVSKAHTASFLKFGGHKNTAKPFPISNGRNVVINKKSGGGGGHCSNYFLWWCRKNLISSAFTDQTDNLPTVLNLHYILTRKNDRNISEQLKNSHRTAFFVFYLNQQSLVFL